MAEYLHHVTKYHHELSRQEAGKLRMRHMCAAAGAAAVSGMNASVLGHRRPQYWGTDGSTARE